MNRKIMIALLAVLFSLSFFTSCATTATKDLDFEQITGSYDFRVLNKYQQKQLPRYVASIVSLKATLQTDWVDVNQIDITDFLTSGMLDTGRFKLVDREQMDKIFEEQNLSLSGMTQDIVEIGKLSNADFVLSASLVSLTHSQVDNVSHYESIVEAIISVQLTDVVTGEIVYSNSTTSGKAGRKIIVDGNGNLIKGELKLGQQAAEAVQKAAYNAVESFKERFALIGTILKANGSEILLDCGKSSGIKVGDYFGFIKMGAPLYHPATGNLINYDYGYLGYGVVSQVSATTCKVTLDELTADSVNAASTAVFLDI